MRKNRQGVRPSFELHRNPIQKTSLADIPFMKTTVCTPGQFCSARGSEDMITFRILEELGVEDEGVF